jgi:hypothetical protein
MKPQKRMKITNRLSEIERGRPKPPFTPKQLFLFSSVVKDFGGQVIIETPGDMAAIEAWRLKDCS